MFKYLKSELKCDLKWFLNQNTTKKKKRGGGQKEGVWILQNKQHLDHRNVQVGRALRRSLVQPPAQRWVSYETQRSDLSSQGFLQLIPCICTPLG